MSDADLGTNLGDADEYRVTEFGASCLCILGTMFLFHAGYGSFAAGAADPVVYAASVAGPWGAGLVLLTVGIAPVDPRPYGRWLAFVVVAGVLAADIVIVFSRSPSDMQFGTDTMLFSRQAVDLLMAGQNPYPATMTPSMYPVDARITPTMDGGHIDSFSYPAGAILAFVPQRALGIGRTPLHLTALVAAVAAATYLIAVSPPEIAVLPAIVFGGLDLFGNATGGLIDGLWLFPLLVSMHAVANGEWRRVGLWFGVAAAVKQQPWFLAPFLLVWAWQANGRGAAAEVVGGSVVAFGVLNLPFVLWDPVAWFSSVLAPVGGSGATLVPQGVGLVAVRTGGLFALPKVAFTLAVAVVAYGLLAVFVRVRGRWRWVAFLAPPLILFVHWRSLPSYFMWFVPVGYMALLGAVGVLRPHPERASDSVTGQGNHV